MIYQLSKLLQFLANGCSICLLILIAVRVKCHLAVLYFILFYNKTTRSVKNQIFYVPAHFSFAWKILLILYLPPKNSSKVLLRDGMTSSSPSPSKFGPENNSVGRHLPVPRLKLVPLQNEKLVRDQEKSGQKSVKTSTTLNATIKCLSYSKQQNFELSLEIF